MLFFENLLLFKNAHNAFVLHFASIFAAELNSKFAPNSTVFNQLTLLDKLEELSVDEVSFPFLFSPPFSDSVELSSTILPSFSGDSARTEGLGMTLSLSVMIGLYLEGKVL